MRTYEALYIVRPELNDDEIQTVAAGVESLITSNGGAIVRSEIWGKRRLAYEVKKVHDGVFVLVRFQSDPSVVSKLKAHFRLSEQILLDQVIHFDEKALRLEAEQTRRNEEQLQARGPEGRGRDRDDDDEDDDDEAPRRRGSRAAASFDRRRDDD